LEKLKRRKRGERERERERERKNWIKNFNHSLYFICFFILYFDNILSRKTLYCKHFFI